MIVDPLLWASILVLAGGPLLYALARRRHSALALLDGLIFVTITGLVLLFVLPHAFEQGGWAVLLFAPLGLFGPTALEAVSRHAARRTHIVTLVLALSGLGLHAMVDGVAIAHGGVEGEPLLPLAVVLHRFPVALTIWWLLRPNFGRRVPVLVLAAMGAATLGGYWSGLPLAEALSTRVFAWFQAFVGGSLMHVVFHQPHLGEAACGCEPAGPEENWWEGVGALLGIGLIIVLLAELDWRAAAEGHFPALTGAVRTFVVLALESAPALLIAYLAAGLLHAFLPASSVEWLRRGSRPAQAAKGMAVGLPFPICSCGVVPLYQSLVQRGAPATAAMAFLIATPELGLDAVVLSFPLLGLEMTVLRVVAAALVALGVGWIVGGLTERAGEPASGRPLATFQEVTAAGWSFKERLLKAVRVGLGEVVDHTAPWILAGIGVAAAVHPFLTSGWPRNLPSLVEVPLFTLLGLPAYVCASGATPLVAVLLSGGVSPGAALALLLTGPATNLTTFGVLQRLHGRRTALVFSVVIIALAMSLGLLVNLWFPEAGSGALDPAEETEAGVLSWLCLALVGLIFVGSLVRRGARRFVGELFFGNRRALDLHPHADYHEVGSSRS
ncbi:MAG: hypothetical protein Kow00109_19060 [Acidobacteriota bacterium]